MPGARKNALVTGGTDGVGKESNFAINYLGRFVLTGRLLPLLQATDQPGEAARIVLVSGAAQNGAIHIDDVNLTTNFTTLRAVWQFCQANDVFTVELARRLMTKGLSLAAEAALEGPTPFEE